MIPPITTEYTLFSSVHGMFNNKGNKLYKAFFLTTTEFKKKSISVRYLRIYWGETRWIWEHKLLQDGLKDSSVETYVQILSPGIIIYQNNTKVL